MGDGGGGKWGDVAENLLLIRDKLLVEKYIKNWQKHDGHSERIIGQ
jgi:hypothetical protein